MERAPGRDESGLPALRAEFPQFRIWGETVRGRVRYVARRLDSGTGLHTVVTSDLAELRAELGGETTQNTFIRDPGQ
jgi:hypothetical protein